MNLTERFSRHWQALPDKDRRALSILLGVVLPAAVIGAWWQPAREAARLAGEERVEAERVLAWVEGQAPLVSAHPVSGKTTMAELPARLQQLAQQQGIVLDRVEADPQGVRAQASQVSLTALSALQIACRAQGIRLLEVRLVRTSSGSDLKLRAGV